MRRVDVQGCVHIMYAHGAEGGRSAADQPLPPCCSHDITMIATIRQTDTIQNNANMVGKKEPMPEFDSLRYTTHAISRMNQRKISRIDVELTLQRGESWINEDDLWVCELGHIRVIAREDQGVGIIITAMRVKGGER